MTTVHVRANQTTVDWAEGAEFVCERTPFVDNLIKHGGLTEVGLALSAADVAGLGRGPLDALIAASDPSKPYVQYAEGGVVDPQDTVPDASTAEDTDPGTEPQKAPRIRRKSS
ncbi:hypothetical protein ACFVWF_32340 [Rhodococcus qingshengii]|uniref:hypothetical protein n=1 Tax=Rhodococcus qingshengii TaxID=334542 RepID=UPI0036DC7288